MAAKQIKKTNAQPRVTKAKESGVKPTYVLHLFVSGATARSHQALLGLNDLCNEKIKGRFKLKVFDIFQQPALAKKNQIVVTPTLIKVFPQKLRRFIGIQGILISFAHELEFPERH